MTSRRVRVAIFLVLGAILAGLATVAIGPGQAHPALSIKPDGSSGRATELADSFRPKARWAPARRGVAIPPTVPVPHGESTSINLLVVSGLDFIPIASPRILVLGLSPGVIEVSGDLVGEVRVDVPVIACSEGAIVVVEGQDHCRRMLGVYPTGEQIVVALEPAGSIRIRLTDENGAPASGIGVTLLPPAEGHAEWTHEWKTFDVNQLGMSIRQTTNWLTAVSEQGRVATARDAHLPFTPTEALSLTLMTARGREFRASIRDALDEGGWTTKTDESGEASWAGVPAVFGYRWGVRDVQVISYEPAATITNMATSNGQLVVQVPMPAEDISGPFSVELGTVRSLEGVVAL